MSTSKRNRTWAAASLSDVARVVRERVKPQDYPELPFVGMDNVEAHTMRLLGTVPSTTMKSASVHFHPGDVLYGRLRPYLNKVIGADFEGLASAEFIPLTTPQGVVPEFIQYRLNASDFVSYASHLHEGDRPRVDYDQIGAFVIDVPPTREQHGIVAAIESYFTRLEAAVATLERVQRNVKRYRASVLKAAVEGRLVPTEAELARAEGRDYEPASVLLERILAERRRCWEEAELAKMKASAATAKSDKWKERYKHPVTPDTAVLPDLPFGWCWVTFDQITMGIDGGNSATATDDVGPRRVLRSSAVRQGSVDINDFRYLPTEASKKSDSNLAAGDLLITRLSGSLDYVANCGIVRVVGDQQMEFPDRLFRARPLEGIVGSYVQRCFEVRTVRRPLESKAKSTAGHQRISLSDLRAFALPLPPTAEQVRLSEEIERLLSLSDAGGQAVDENIRRGARLRQAILKWAFEGRLVDQIPIDEPASKLLERIRAERESIESRTSTQRVTRKARSSKA